MRDIIFFAGKLHNGPFQGIFRGGQDFFDPEIAPRCAQDNLGSLRSPGSIPKNFTLTFNFNVNRKNPAKYPRMAKNPPKSTTAYIVQ